MHPRIPLAFLADEIVALFPYCTKHLQRCYWAVVQELKQCNFAGARKEPTWVISVFTPVCRHIVQLIVLPRWKETCFRIIFYIELWVKADLSLTLKNAENVVLNPFNFDILRDNANKYLNFSDRELFENFSSIKVLSWILTIFWKCEIPLHFQKYVICHELYVMNFESCVFR